MLGDFSRVRGVKECRALIRGIQAGCGAQTVKMRRVRDPQMPLPTRRKRQLVTYLESRRDDCQRRYVESINTAFEVPDAAFDAPVRGGSPDHLSFRALDGCLAGIREERRDTVGRRP